MVVAPKKPCKELTKAQKSRIWTLYEEGYNPTEIWHKTKIPRTTVIAGEPEGSRRDCNTMEKQRGRR
jgi:hypothetical protein